MPADRPWVGVRVGALGYGALARVDACGAVRTADLALDWWVGADDRWHVPAEETTTRDHDGLPPVTISPSALGCRSTMTRWPAVKSASVRNPALDAMGPFRADPVSIAALGRNTPAAQKLVDRAGWR